MNKEVSKKEVRQSRRDAIRNLGMGIFAAMTAGSVADAATFSHSATGLATTATPMRSINPDLLISGGRLNVMALPKNLRVNPKFLELKLADPRALQVLHLDRRLPMNTPITKMGLDPKFAKVLTPGARRLTKGDLEALAARKVTRATSVLTIEDIKSVQVAFASGFDGSQISMDISCCCCTPCCCAAAYPAEKTAA